MKNKLQISIITSFLFCSVIMAQTTLYIPGTGTSVKKLDFESTIQLTEKFNYGNGWAGTGFSLTGTQRGAPEDVSVIANPQSVTSSGSQVMAFRSFDRDAAWYNNNPSAVGTNVYGAADTEDQDDFFMTGAGWTPAETPSVMMHTFVPDYLDNNSVVTSLRMPIKFNALGDSYSSWPGIWCHGSFFVLRGPGRRDILQDTNAPNGGKNTWWTFGVSIAPDGDIQYYATPSYVTQLTKEHLIGINSVMSAEIIADGGDANDYAYYPVAKSSDAIIMSSNVNTTSEKTLFDNIMYTKGTSQVLSVAKNELLSVSIYPNPTADFLFINGLKEDTSYKISDNLGRIIKTAKIATASNKIEVASLPKGIYFLILEGYKANTFVKN
ncbi:T9SS type A sorting domain-containing protein [Polaribacter sp. IC073]|uniref:T9SS type A sorting domain-containing protein n=1 Tax=Polaribacter sp. IC073 TaxID=2508540 RepID=UPI0011BEC04E|nr:T9SS type A sorting domain-containing protein [Polaribacter sp. IC073]TXD46769.1 T9SS type A sorting domain-containing protein [Polaribacter sp. IC073]